MPWVQAVIKAHAGSTPSVDGTILTLMIDVLSDHTLIAMGDSVDHTAMSGNLTNLPTTGVD